MSAHTVLKCPADFFVLGPNDVVLGRDSQVDWSYGRQGNLTDQAIINCSRFLGSRYYSDRLRQRFEEAAGEAIPFVTTRTHPDFPVNVGLFRFTNQGQRCVVLTVDSLPLPELPIVVPSPTDPCLQNPRSERDLAHAWILPRVDSYLVVWDREVLQLSLGWSESVW